MPLGRPSREDRKRQIIQEMRDALRSAASKNRRTRQMSHPHEQDARWRRDLMESVAVGADRKKRLA